MMFPTAFSSLSLRQALSAMVVIVAMLMTFKATGQTRTLDAMDDPATWKVVTPEGVRLSVSRDEGRAGPGSSSLRLDYEFVTGGGYCIVELPIAMEIPSNYEFAFYVRGAGPENNLEFKLVDQTGESVWWVNRRSYEWPKDWTRVSNKKSRLEFAWGPSAGAPLKTISRIEFAIASSSGGKGSVWLDDLTFRELPPPVPADELPSVKIGVPTMDGSQATQDITALVTGREAAGWTPPARNATAIIDLGVVREFGGVSIGHDTVMSMKQFVSVEASDDGTTWNAVTGPREMRGSGTLLITPDAEARFIRLRWTQEGSEDHDAGRPLPRITSLRVEDAVFSTTPNHMMSALASRARRGVYPKFTLDTQSYFTVIGAEGDVEEALINEEGAIEVAKRGFTIEPFISQFDKPVKLLTWADGTNVQSLADGFLPIPTVTRTHEGLTLEVTGWTDESGKEPILFAAYALTNTGQQLREVTLNLAIRPFQVNPPWQRLNFEGGVAPITRLEKFSSQSTRELGLLVTSNRLSRVIGVVSPSESISTGVLAVPFSGGEIMNVLASSTRTWFPDLPVTDPDQLASGVLTFDMTLQPGASKRVVLAMPMRNVSPEQARAFTATSFRTDPDASLKATKALWRERLDRVELQVPKADAWLANVMKSTLAYILINRDGPAIQPGSRSYERSWARDGSLTSAAMLRVGHAEEVRMWIDWYAKHQFPSGGVPCVVDTRGPDPVPEHDSHGQYIWAVAEYYRFTGDKAFLSQHKEGVRKAVDYIQSLRAPRLTDEFRNATDPLTRAKYGLVTESISHEGYSAKPMHSYWDCFFVMLGLKEARFIAQELGDSQQAQTYDAMASEFRGFFMDSIGRAMKATGVDYIPGCVELGDFDATSTTIALWPCDEGDHVPQAALRRTFDKAWENFVKRRDGQMQWDAYTPYEWRTVGAMVRLNERQRAYEMLQWFRRDMRPQGWNHWAEVVWNDIDNPRFLGDMPHTWCGSDFMNSVMALFLYERPDQWTAFAGIPKAWIDSGEPLGVTNLRVPALNAQGTGGRLTLRMQRTGTSVRARIEGDALLPEGGIVLKLPPGCEGEDHLVKQLPAEREWKLTQ